MANKKLIEKIIKETEDRSGQSKEALERSELMERFANRWRLTHTAQGSDMLVKVTKEINTFKILIKMDEELLKFLNEIKNE